MDDYLGLAFLAFLLLFGFGRIVYKWFQRECSQNWTTVQAVVEETKSSFYETRYGTYWKIVIAFSYAYEGEYYGGNQSWTNKSEARVNAVADTLPKGSAIFVRLDPKHPWDSLLREDDNPDLATALNT